MSESRMRVRTLLLRNLAYHAKANLAVLLGVVVATAVLTGALLVGDSLRGSLRALTLNRLGGIDHAVVSPRFFRADLASDLAGQPGFTEVAERVAPAIILRGSVLRRDAGGNVVRRAGGVQVVGVEESFWPLFDEQRGGLSNAVLVNAHLAAELGVQEGDLVEVRLEQPRAIPADSVLGRPVDDPGVVIEASPVAEVLPNAGAGRFSLNTQQQQPFILYVSLHRLQTRLRDSVHQSDAANALLVQARDTAGAQRLQELLGSAVTLDDLGLTLRRDQTGSRYLSLESRRMLLEPIVVEKTLELVKLARWQAAPTLTYLANRVYHGERFTPYSTITGLEPSAGPPWGPLRLVDGTPAPALENDEILLNEWIARDLWPNADWQKDIGKPLLTVSYFVERQSHEQEGWLLKEETRTFKLAGVVALDGPAADRTLTPDFPGIRGTRVADWKPPFPKEQWHPEWVRERDEDYWRKHRATPKAFVSPEAATHLWKSRHGQWTSIRLANPPADLAALEAEFRERIRELLPPELLGIQFQAVKEQGLSAAGSSTAESFGWLFLGFSSFLIGSAAMLVGLLFRLNIERRAKEVGLLYAAGFRQRTVRRLLLGEGALLAAVGGLIGIGVAIGYAWLLLAGLRHGWSETLQTSFLQLHIAEREAALGPLPYPSLTLGWLLGFAVSLVAVYLSVRGLAKLSPRGLLAGQAAEETGRQDPPWRPRRLLLPGASLFVALALAASGLFVPATVAPGLFFVSGAALVAAGLVGLRMMLRREHGRLVRPGSPLPLIRLGARNAGRRPGRSLLTAGLLASATFLVVAVEAFRKDPGEGETGAGRYNLVAEADVPMLLPPNAPEHRRALLPGASAAEQDRLNNALKGVSIASLRVRPGDDVSCLNLYQPQEPRILGVPEEGAAAYRYEPLWSVLRGPSDGPLPVAMDEHTAAWVLHKSLGDVWTIADESGRAVPVRLAALLKESIFQSELLMSEEHFRRLFPSRSGFGSFLILAPAERANEVKHALEQAFGERYGLTVSRSADRLASFHAVENTYLSTFQLLGGLGLLLGTLGLAVVLLRNVWERQGELALLRALGYPRSALARLVLSENGFLVLMGLGVGVLAALLAVAPHLLERAGRTPWSGVAILVGLSLLVGLSAGGLALRSALRSPLLPALRRE